MKQVTYAVLLLIYLGFTACRKTEVDRIAVTKTCEALTEIMVDGNCVLKPEYVRFGDLTLMRGAMWITTSGCIGVDSAAIGFMIDTVSAGYYLRVPMEFYVNDPNNDNMIDLPEPEEPNYFPDPVRGDSVYFVLRTKGFDWVKPNESRVGKFYGRFDPQRTRLVGRIIYTTGIHGPKTGETCENAVFKPLL